FTFSGLKEDLRQSLYGQHVVSDVVLKAVTSFMTDSNPNKPLVLSFYGTTGTGKNHVTTIIARNIYKKGKNSENVHLFSPYLHFSYKDDLHIYSANLKKWISGNVSSFPRSMFIFDQMDYMLPELIDVIKPFLGYSAHIDGVSFRKAIFIFLSNAGGQMLSKLALDFWREGKDRKAISMNIMNEKSKFLRSSIIDDLVDHYIPFLPLELKHVRQCVMTEMVHLKIPQDFKLADQVARAMPFYPEKEEVFSVKGCRSVRQMLALKIHFFI
ncbi:torsin-1B-like, partial [Garra rufa]|uniref:torsin-1B-like n=1 Tax=Garra rufa TaxID=137080 RepID=UPI003CCE6E38